MSPDPQHRSLSPATTAVAAGRPPREQGAPVNAPVVLSSTYVSTGTPGAEEMLYTRYNTETWLPLEEAVGALEGAALPALAFASGMAAIDAVLRLATPGSAVVAPRHAYLATLTAAREQAEREGSVVREVDIADTDAVVAALAPDGEPAASVLWIESPTNPMLEVADVPALAAAAHAAGALCVVDNTFATPLGQRPLAQGADVVVHSVTKFLAGHSDLVMGAAVTDDAGLRARLHARRTTGGAIPGPWEAWLALRGLRTLALRVERSQASALELARRLAEHPLVAEVSHPGLPSHPQHERAAELMDGFGSILTLRPAGGAAAAEALTRAVELWVPATSLGGVESSLERRRRLPAEAGTVPEDLLRLSVGIEDVEDLWADLDRALHAAANRAG
ncbi:PLP-dependent aspartate aminotransferase family protein [Georgenia sp. EYE_87]|uniref:trans-sulfuration enzyme family protein n=1 Tax=Georgenia sp. EYE_87 TaxID=2853448 RepID=UPI0020049CFA|nr:PLP-dependent aspartate aminotransferase family protein [Georgenia sp. EYE_87]MCK6211991.1 PLP-dependent aspartate aminotransferase family protein [Georgenia sp. EYE_87]